ncbi:CRTAC1 family protein [Wenzhouxiangella marina]|uniref:RNA-binding protein n=1 Tax=Wenzhouxiangella marina TaxID=1579979 RepID=A0A0K0XZB8_9GAMM|nr:CRTAC1 family protein [Wenzhouxiangella marina]AKS42966.1 RNA-binding protein [Wenzhouxiangella marina]MBB6087350.1 hypothetical protein [Wenzhouxiangella marina]
MSQHDRNEAFEDELDADDSIIARALKISLSLILLLALVVAAVLVWRHLSGPEPEPVEEAEAVDLEALLAPEAGPRAPAARFVDRTAEAGIDYLHVNGAFGERLLPETMGGGVAVIDHDGDGDQDLLFVSGRSWPFDPEPPLEAASSLRLYANDGEGGFEEVTEAVGLAGERFYGMGVAVGDVDGDGRVDVFVTAVGPNRFYLNRPEGFVEVAESAGVDGGANDWSTGAAFFDADGDGDLDLWVTNYVQWSREIDLAVDYRLTGIGRAYGPPSNFAGTHSRLYLNQGEGRFEDVTESAGLIITHPTTGEPIGKGLAVMPVDVDRDGLLDVIVANDTVRNFAFRNLGGGRFEELGTEWGLGFDRNGMATGAMGIDAGPALGDDRLAVAIGNFANEMSSLYLSQADPSQFADQSIAQGVGAATRLALTFGVGFIDYDNDGRLDYAQANGHVENEINRVQASQHYRQPGQLFWNCGADCSQTFQPLEASRIGDLAEPIVGRGLAWGDFDQDGRIDLVLTQIGGAPLLLFNETDTDHHWLGLELIGRAPNTSAIGAEVRIEVAGRELRRRIMPARSYLSSVALPLTIGLGAADRVERLSIRWPDGELQQIERPTVDQRLRITQP